MKCPTCPSSSLVIAERSGVEIDYCPQCRGVWLDRGELDKLVERAAARPEPHRQPQFADSDHGHRHAGSHRRKSWLSDIFD
ncbi:MAG: zf-TFIIB domain-containing protein [Ramlibacter sp.]|jgi:Zn-finger nucleic acid-binding protein|nr:zf-TFIIB domain-containing protein [Ramlibacter sp.]